MNPIFIIGTERSGTNLLRLILNAHSHIAVPHPPHIMKLFSPIVRSYGDLGQDRNFRKLVNDVCRMVELHPYPWEVALDRDQIFLSARDRSLIGVYFALYDRYLASTGKERWACKSTFMIEHVADILRYYPDARFIHMVRDGRDVAVSAKSSIFNHYHVFYSAQRWKREQRLGLSWQSRLLPEQILQLKYEELIKDPVGIAGRLCAFLNEPFEETMVEYHRSSEAAKSGSLSISWENTSRPVISNNAEKFRTHLSEQEVLLFEAVAANELTELGYPVMHSPQQIETGHAELVKPRLIYRLADAGLFLKAEAKHLFGDRNSAQRLKKALYMRYLSLVRRIM